MTEECKRRLNLEIAIIVVELLSGRTKNDLALELTRSHQVGLIPKVIRIPRMTFYGVKLEFADVEDMEIIFEPQQGER